ncbi:MAG TPA: MFS transporter [Glaciihabitans sp.]|nr:MFS transporter [Glaciihabitans sp.]
MLSVLRHPAYRNLFTAQLVALLGTGLLTVALGLLAFDLAGPAAGAVLGTALTIKMVAYVGVAPVIAALVERLPKKAVLVSADVVRALVALSLPFITDTWQIYVLVFVLQSASATFTPAFQSLIPVVLPVEREYTKALSLSRLAYDLEALVSPILAALLLTVLTYNSLFLGTVLGFIGSAIFVLITRLPAIPAVTTIDNLWLRTTRGARIFARTPSLRFLMAMNLTVGAATAHVLVNTVVYSRDVFALSASSLATALACYGAGSLVVALNVPRLLDRFRDRTVMLAGGALASAGLLLTIPVTIFAPAWPGAWWALLGLWVILGAGNSLISTPSSRLLMRAATDQTRGAIYTAQFSLSHACFLITYPLAGWVGAASLSAAVIVLGALALASTLLAARLWEGESHHAGSAKPAPVRQDKSADA